MKKGIIKKVAFTVFGALLLVLGACTNGGEKDQNIEQKTGTTEEKNTDEVDPYGAYKETVSFTLGRYTDANPMLPEGDTYEDNAYTRYLKQKLNVELSDAFEANGADYDRQISLAIASGNLPDMMRVSNRNELQELVENGLVADLTDVYEEYATDYLKSLYDSYDGECLDTATFDGKLMAIPATNLDNGPCEVWIRQDWVEQLGMVVDPDKNGCITKDELYEIAKTFMDNDPGNSKDPVGISLMYWLNNEDYNASTYSMMAIANAMGAYPKMYFRKENEKIYYGSTTNEMRKALGILAEWFKTGILDPQFATRTWEDMGTLLANGQTGIVFGPWHLPDWNLITIKKMDSMAKFKAYALEDENGKVNAMYEKAAGSFIVVRKGFEHPELAIKIANIFYDELVNSETLEQDAPEVVAYMKNGVGGSTRPFNIEINKSTSLLEDYADICNGVYGTISLDQVKTRESKILIEIIKNYLEHSDRAGATAWAKYTSRIYGVGLINHLTENKLFHWVQPLYFESTPNMEDTKDRLTKLEEESFIKIIIGEEPLDYFDVFVKNYRKQGGERNLKEIEEELKYTK